MDTAISPLELQSLLATADGPLLLDVRRPPAFEADAKIIPGASRPAGDLVEFARRHAGGRLVVAYCVHGHEVSRSAARSLRDAGFEAAFLEGGIEGWRAAGHATIPFAGRS